MTSVTRPGAPNVVSAAGGSTTVSASPARGNRRMVIGGRSPVAPYHKVQYDDGVLLSNPVPSTVVVKLVGDEFGPLEGTTFPFLVWITNDDVEASAEDPDVLPEIRIETPGRWNVLLTGQAAGYQRQRPVACTRQFRQFESDGAGGFQAPAGFDDSVVYERRDGAYRTPETLNETDFFARDHGLRWSDRFTIDVGPATTFVEAAYILDYETTGPPISQNLSIATRWVMWR